MNETIEKIIWDEKFRSEFIDKYHKLNVIYKEYLRSLIQSDDNLWNKDFYDNYILLRNELYWEREINHFLENMEVISSYFDSNKEKYQDDFEGLLSKCLIDYEIYKTNDLSRDNKNDIKHNIMVLYSWAYQSINWLHDFDKNVKFLKEIEKNIDLYFDSDNVEFHFLKIKGATVISSFFKKLNDWALYWGGLNSSYLFRKSKIWFYFFEKLLEDKWKENNLEWTVTTEIEGKENNWYKGVLKIYKKYWFEEVWFWETDNSKYIKLRRNKG